MRTPVSPTRPSLASVFAAFLVLLLSQRPVWSQSTAPAVWSVPGYVRLDTSAQPVFPAVEIWAAQGETESFQIGVRAGASGLTNVNVAVSSLAGAGNNVIPKSQLTLYREHFVSVDRAPAQWGTINRPQGTGLYADALIPFVDPVTQADLTGALDAVPFRVAPNSTQIVWVDVTVPRGAGPGVYRGIYTVTSAQGTSVGEFFVTVWNFQLPVKPRLYSSFAFWNPATRADHQELLRHRLSPLNVPPREQRDLIDRFGLGSTNLGFWSGADSQTCRVNPPPSQNQLMAAKAANQSDLHLFNFTADEIESCPGMVEPIKAWSRALRGADIKQLLTMKPIAELLNDGTGRPAADIWVMLPKMYDQAGPILSEALGKGCSIWTYNTLVQDSYSPKWLIGYDWVNYRIHAGMLNSLYNATGLLYWRADMWSQDPWNDVNNTGMFSSNNYPGEGLLVYPGREVGLESVVPSIRLKALRDGVDDFDYVSLLAEKGRKEWALGEIARVARSWESWSTDPKAVEAVRRTLGNELAGINKPPQVVRLISPANSSTGLATPANLSWAMADPGTRYQVYLGAQGNPGMMGETYGGQLKTGPLEAGTQYFWYVRALAGSGTSLSPVFSFTTSAGPDTVRPTLAVGSPAEGATVSGTVPVLITAADNVGVTRVEFSIDGVFRQTAMSAPFSWAWNTAGLAPGPHRITVVAYDAVWNMDIVTRTVSVAAAADTVAPALSITTPVNGAIVAGNVNVQAASTDNVGVTRAEFFVDGVFHSSDLTAPYSFFWNAAAASKGSHVLTVVTYDAVWNRALQAITVKVQ